MLKKDKGAVGPSANSLCRSPPPPRVPRSTSWKLLPSWRYLTYSFQEKSSMKILISFLVDPIHYGFSKRYVHTIMISTDVESFSLEEIMNTVHHTSHCMSYTWDSLINIDATWNVQKLQKNKTNKNFNKTRPIETKEASTKEASILIQRGWWLQGMKLDWPSREGAGFGHGSHWPHRSASRRSFWKKMKGLRYDAIV